MNEYIYMNEDDLKDGISDDNCKIFCLKKNEKGYFIHIICCQFSDKDALKDNWKELMYNVADKIQKNLNEIIEIYNVYILFFSENAGEALVNEIEQNKYSSRKIVLKKNMPEVPKLIEKIIDEKLFELDIKIENNRPSLFIKNMEFLNNNDDEKRAWDLEKHIEQLAMGDMNEKNQ